MSDVKKWDVEDKEFWESTGKAIARRNLWISIPSLLCGFAVWLYWGIITVQMLNLGFPFTQAELFTLTAIAGLSGATLRIPSTFFIRIAGGRNTIFFTTALLMLPAIGAGFALRSADTPLWTFQLLALLYVKHQFLFSEKGAGRIAGPQCRFGEFRCYHHADTDSPGDDGRYFWWRVNDAG